jgi:Protein of unknown function (DUF3347).
MSIKQLFVVVALLTAVPTFAAGTKIYTSYETTRQALIKTSVADVQAGAKQVAVAARVEKQVAIAAKADALAEVADLAAARNAFAALSDEMIKFRASDKGDRPIVVYCPMEKKSWLQPKGEVGNPYLSAGMRKCGEIKQQ